MVVGCHVVADRCGATLGCDILTELELHPGNIQTPFTLFHFSIGHYCRGTVLSYDPSLSVQTENWLQSAEVVPQFPAAIGAQRRKQGAR